MKIKSFISATAIFTLFISSTALASESAHMVIVNKTPHTIVAKAPDGTSTHNLHVKAGTQSLPVRDKGDWVYKRGWGAHDYFKSFALVHDEGTSGKIYQCGTVPASKISYKSRGQVVVTVHQCDNNGMSVGKSGSAYDGDE
jgi:hypothetical protein